ncbi:MAG: HlyD family efflux transporter periplasmic adaptor subunit [Cyanobacteriota bacterium]|nr:HlyD family efflux transporter periplasmic adaptor subunit [Cyanobacteriota bacterium]
MKHPLHSLPPLTLALALAGAAALPVALVQGCQRRPPEPAESPTPRRVSALGRIEPETKIRKVSVSSSLSGDRIQEILVEENQWVKKGQPLAVLNSYGSLKASLQEADELVALQRDKLAQVKAGAKEGEIRAQAYKVESLERELAGERLSQDQSVASKRSKMQEARTEAQRYEMLFRNGGASELQRDRYRTRAETTQAELNEAIESRATTLRKLESDIASARQTLAQIKEVRPVDVAAAESELRKAVAARDRARQEFDFATVRAPQDGRILKIVARPGDKVGDDGLLEMADTSQMIVTAEVYQTDMARIRQGLGATIRADGIEGSLRGTVYQLVPQVQRQSIFAGEPGENQDQRVFEVKLRLDPQVLKNSRIGYASNLQVNVIFDPLTQTNTP